MKSISPKHNRKKTRSQANETPHPDLNISAISPITKKTVELEKWAKFAVAIIALLFLVTLAFWPGFFMEKLSGKTFATSADIVGLLSLEVILIFSVIGSRWGKIKETVYQSLMWQNGVGLLRYGAACLSIAFLIFAWAAGGFAATIFGTSSTPSTAQQIYNFVQLFLFFGLSTIGGTLLTVVNFIEASYNFARENSDFLNPYNFIAKKITEICCQIQAEVSVQLKNGSYLELSDFSKPIYVLSWNVRPEEKIIEIQLGNRLAKENDGQVSPDKKGKWASYKINVDFKGRILSIQRYEVDDYQKIRS